MILCGGQFVTDFGLDKVSVGELQGTGIWPLGVSIILSSLFVDRIGYAAQKNYLPGNYDAINPVKSAAATSQCGWEQPKKGASSFHRARRERSVLI